jgi:hypothetical protein
MAAFAYTNITYKLATAGLNLSTADIRVKCLMSSTTADEDEDATNLAGITTVDEFDGSGYSELDLASITVTKQNDNDRTEVDAASGNFGSTVSAGTRSIVALLYYVYVDGTTSNDYPLAYDDTPAEFPLQADGGPLNITIDPTGFLHIAA